jgi:Ring finger domain
MRCSICLKEGEEEEEEEEQNIVFKELSCGHSFHFGCVKELRNPFCPLCRAPIQVSDSSPLSADLINEMGKRARADKEEADNRGLEEAGAFERIPLNDNTDGIINEILSAFRLSVLSTIRPQNFAEAMYRHFYNERYPYLRRYSDEHVCQFMEDFHYCLFAELEKGQGELDQEVVEWFSEHLATSFLSEALHRASHERFPGMECGELKRHAQTALCVNLGTRLLAYSLKKK